MSTKTKTKTKALAVAPAVESLTAYNDRHAEALLVMLDHIEDSLLDALEGGISHDDFFPLRAQIKAFDLIAENWLTISHLRLAREEEEAAS